MTYLACLRRTVKAVGTPIGNRPALLLAILLIFTGVQLIAIGLLAELQTRAYHAAQNKVT